MTSSVRQIGTKVASLDEVRLFFRRARSSEALIALRSFDGADAAILQARCLLRLGRAGEARQACSGLNVDALGTELFAELLLVLAQADLSLRSFESAAALLDDARVFVISSASATLEAEHLYLQARLAYDRGDAVKALERARAVLDVCEPFGLPQAPNSCPSLETSQARAYELIGFTHLRSRDLAGNLESLSRSLSLLGRDPKPDAYFTAAIVSNYSAMARELDPSAERYAAIEKFFASIEWTEELNELRFLILRSLGWIAAVDGDHIGALRCFRQAGRLSRDPLHEAWTHVDRAFLAHELGQRVFASEEIAEALDVIETIDWTNPPGESFVLLVMLAQLVAIEDPVRAEELVALYHAARAATDRRFATVSGPRMEAMELFALAKIAATLGKRDDAIGKFEKARALWAEVGCAWRAGLAASELARLGAGRSYEQMARREAESRPRSFYSKRAAIGLAS